MTRTDLEDAIARDLRNQAAGAPTGEAVVVRVRALTAALQTAPGRRPGRLAPVFAAVAIVAVVLVVAGGVVGLRSDGPAADQAIAILSRPVVAGPACVLTDMRVTAGSVPGHVGTGVIIVFRNAGVACALDSYPIVHFEVSGRDGPLPTYTLSGPLGGVTGTDHPPLVWMPPGTTVSAMVESDILHHPGDVSCAAGDHLLVSFIEADRPVRLAVPISLCDDEVHPFVPGTTGNLAARK